MKKVLLLIALVTMPLVSYGQSIFDKLEDMDGVTSIIVNKDAFEILSKFKGAGQDNEAMEIFKMVEDLNELKVFTTDKASIAKTMDNMVSSAIKKSKLTELMRIKEEDTRVKIYVKSTSKKDFVSEVLMFVKGADKHTNGEVESVVISLTGNIDINNLSKLADTFTKESGIKIKRNK